MGGARQTFRYKEKPLEERKKESSRIRDKYCDRIPVICERHSQSDVPDIDKTKYLVPMDLNAGQFIYVVRKRIKLAPEQALFLFINGILPPTAAQMNQLYQDCKDEDGFLYIKYSGESSFGALEGVVPLSDE
eukprot:TRINITY_DN912_c0_g4_i1.p1 TRINITY_DN912_c0_g4~~TRINITY_DN912_c0_g4_i1.p1  ORF type:complete len:132 (+),score=24.05 TRINITY_DN912_c0_g4_i1:79-474(+)